MNLLVPSGAIPDSAWPGWGKACGWPQGGGRMGPETHSFVSAFNRCLSSGRMLGSVQGLGTGSSATRRPESRPCGACGLRRRRVAAGRTHSLLIPGSSAHTRGAFLPRAGRAAASHSHRASHRPPFLGGTPGASWPCCGNRGAPGGGSACSWSGFVGLLLTTRASQEAPKSHGEGRVPMPITRSSDSSTITCHRISSSTGPHVCG